MPTQTPPTILRVAIYKPLRRVFDYLPPEGCTPQNLHIGMRLYVPFGRSKVVGILIATGTTSTFPLEKLKPVISLLEPAI